MKKSFFLIAFSLTISACGGGGGSSTNTGGGTGGTGGDVSGLEMPANMDVVVADQDGIQPRSINLRAVRSVLSRAATDPDTDYSTDEQRSWVHDGALEPLDEVNMILCFMDQTRADQLVNQTYVALVDSAGCERDGAQGGNGQNQSSGGGRTVEYERWLVASTRADNSSPQYVRIWAPENGDDDFKQTIYAEMTILEGVSETNPYGRFTLNFEGRAITDFTTPWTGESFTAGDVLMRGTLKTVDAINGKIGFTLYNNSVFGGEQKVSVMLDADLSTGVAFTGGDEYDDQANGGSGGRVTKAYGLAFNDSNILIQPVDSYSELDAINNLDAATVEANGGYCLSRTEFKRNVWRYDLYDAISGTRVAVNSGFPFTYNGSYGWVGYWGVWAENPPTSGWDGVSISRETFGSSAAPEVFTLAEGPGKLTKREKAEIPLTGLDGETFNYSRWDAGDGQSMDYKVEYDSNGQVADAVTVTRGAGFYITHEIQWRQDGPPLETSVADGPQLITFDQSGDDPWLGMWSQSLGGSVSYDSVNNPLKVTFYKETFINANDAIFAASDTLTLDCYTECLRPLLTVDQYTDQEFPSSAYYPDAATGPNPEPAAVYRFDRSTLALTVVEPLADAGKVVSLAGDYSFNSNDGNSFEPWGIGSGALVPAGTTVSSKWDTWNQQESYRWETGHNEWNKVISITDSGGSVVSFDPPLAFSYQHALVNDANGAVGQADVSYYDKTFLLEYAGNGDLWGVPWVSDGNDQQRPAFAIADNTLMGPNGDDYLIKGREMELKPASASGACSGTGGLVLNQPAAPLPTAVDGAPSNAGSAEPASDDDSPAVVGGVVQGR